MQFSLNEALELNTAALDSIYIAMYDGVEHGYRGKWRSQDFATHLDHAIMHLLALKYVGGGGDDEDHLSHALCRLAMAATMEYDESEESSNDVDRWESEGGAALGQPETVGDSVQSPGCGQLGGYQFEHGQVRNHASGLSPKQPPIAGPSFSTWNCTRCNRDHPYIENCKY